MSLERRRLNSAVGKINGNAIKDVTKNQCIRTNENGGGLRVGSEGKCPEISEL